MSETRVDPDDAAEIVGGRRFPYATVGDYVALSDASDRACRIYWILRMHVNGKRGDNAAWPTQKTLAQILKLKKTDTIGAAISELVALGAVEVETFATPEGRRNRYTVHEAPPEEYDGHAKLADFYRARKDAGPEGSPPGEGSPPNRRRIGGKPAGQRGSPPSGGSPRSGIEGHPSPGGDGSPPSRGSELPVVKPAEKNQGGDVVGERHPRERTPASDAPQPPRPQPGKPETWRCARHLAEPDPLDRPCPACKTVRLECEARQAQLDADARRAERVAELERERAADDAAKERGKAALDCPARAEARAIVAAKAKPPRPPSATKRRRPAARPDSASVPA